MLKVVLTGGPCSGKTSALSIIPQKLADRGYQVLCLPEVPTLLITGGIVPDCSIDMTKFQRFVLTMQLANEDLFRGMEEYTDPDRLVLIMDRGVCDQLAYMEKDAFQSLLKEKGLSLAGVYDRYDGVIHMVTAADGAEEHYQWNDPAAADAGNNAARFESPEKAREKDKSCLRAWTGHPHLRIVDNSTGFEGKIRRVLAEICHMLGEPDPKDIERRFLIRRPGTAILKKLGPFSRSEIVQTYLISHEKKVERRIRQRGTRETGYSFFYTEKEKTGKGARLERQRNISKEEYISLLAEADTSLHQIHKERCCFVYENQYFELDLFPFSRDLAILELEVKNIEEKIVLPPWARIVREITEEDGLRNHSIARTLTLL